MLAGAGWLMSCSGASRLASTPGEKRDEIRAIAAIARSQEQPAEGPVCVDRLIEGDPAFERLSSTKIDAVTRHFEKNMGRGDDRRSSNRTLIDTEIADALGRVPEGDSCTGSAYLQFARLQFKGSEAAAIALKWHFPTCGLERLLFRVKRRGDGWEVADVRSMGRSTPYVCEPRAVAARTGSFGPGR